MSEVNALLSRSRLIRGFLAFLALAVALLVSWFTLTVVEEAAYGQGSSGGSVMLVAG